MARICAITKKGALKGGGYANRTRATIFTPVGKTYRYPNIQKKRVFVPELNKTYVLNLSTDGLKIIKKKGAYAALTQAGVIKQKKSSGKKPVKAEAQEKVAVS